MRERLPYLALALLTSLPAAGCSDKLTPPYKITAQYHQCGHEDYRPGRSIPSDHLVWIDKWTRDQILGFIPGGTDVYEAQDLGVHPRCVEQLAQTPRSQDI